MKLCPWTLPSWGKLFLQDLLRKTPSELFNKIIPCPVYHANQPCLPTPIESIASSCCLWKAGIVIKDHSCPSYFLFSLLFHICQKETSMYYQIQVQIPPHNYQIFEQNTGKLRMYFWFPPIYLIAVLAFFHLHFLCVCNTILHSSTFLFLQYNWHKCLLHLSTHDNSKPVLLFYFISTKSIRINY